MLKVWLGSEREHTLLYIDRSFKSLYKDTWVSSQLAKDFIKDIDKSVVNSPYSIISPVFGNMSPFMLSKGSKGLLILLNTDRVIDADAIGENCAPWLVKIGKIKDCEIDLSYFMPIDPDGDEVLILNDNTVVTTRKEMRKKQLQYID